MWMNNLILIASIAVPSVVMIVVLLVARWVRRRDKRRSPLTNKLLNFPGEQLRKDVIKYKDAFGEAAVVAFVVGPVVLAAWLLARMKDVDWSRLQYGIGDFVFITVGLGILAWCLVRMVLVSRNLRRVQQGLEAELAVGQSLSLLQSEGGLVYHDFPTDRGNIDHIVVGRSVVFAVETKSRRKPEKTGRDMSQIQYDGSLLHYPGGAKEGKPIGQARYQAEWLAKFLHRGLGGEQVRVVPLVALPGWYVEPPKGMRPDVLVSNCHSPQFMMGDKFGPPLSDTFRHRIAHVIEQHYPALELGPSQ